MLKLPFIILLLCLDVRCPTQVWKQTVNILSHAAKREGEKRVPLIARHVYKEEHALVNKGKFFRDAMKVRNNAMRGEFNVAREGFGKMGRLAKNDFGQFKHGEMRAFENAEMEAPRFERNGKIYEREADMFTAENNDVLAQLKNNRAERDVIADKFAKYYDAEVVELNEETLTLHRQFKNLSPEKIEYLEGQGNFKQRYELFEKIDKQLAGQELLAAKTRGNVGKEAPKLEGDVGLNLGGKGNVPKEVDSGPTNIKVFDKGPTSLQKVEQNLPAKLNEGPTGLQIIKEGPNSLQKVEKGPTGVQVVNEGPNSLQKVEKGPTGVQVFEKGPTSIQKVENGPTGVQVFEKGPTSIQKVEKGPTGVQVFEKGPTGVQVFEKGPTGVQVYDKGTTGVQVFEKGPTGVQVYDKGTTGVQVFEKGPTGVQVYDKGTTSLTKMQKGPSELMVPKQGVTSIITGDQPITGLSMFKTGISDMVKKDIAASQLQGQPKDSKALQEFKHNFSALNMGRYGAFNSFGGSLRMNGPSSLYHPTQGMLQSNEIYKSLFATTNPYGIAGVPRPYEGVDIVNADLNDVAFSDPLFARHQQRRENLLDEGSSIYTPFGVTNMDRMKATTTGFGGLLDSNSFESGARTSKFESGISGFNLDEIVRPGTTSNSNSGVTGIGNIKITPEMLERIKSGKFGTSGVGMSMLYGPYTSSSKGTLLTRMMAKQEVEATGSHIPLPKDLTPQGTAITPYIPGMLRFDPFAGVRKKPDVRLSNARLPFTISKGYMNFYCLTNFHRPCRSIMSSFNGGSKLDMYMSPLFVDAVITAETKDPVQMTNYIDYLNNRNNEEAQYKLKLITDLGVPFTPKPVPKGVPQKEPKDLSQEEVQSLREARKHLLKRSFDFPAKVVSTELWSNMALFGDHFRAVGLAARPLEDDYKMIAGLPKVSQKMYAYLRDNQEQHGIAAVHLDDFNKVRITFTSGKIIVKDFIADEKVEDEVIELIEADSKYHTLLDMVYYNLLLDCETLCIEKFSEEECNKFSAVVVAVGMQLKTAQKRDYRGIGDLIASNAKAAKLDSVFGFLSEQNTFTKMLEKAQLYRDRLEYLTVDYYDYS